MSREETVALVDAAGRVVGRAARSRMRAENLRHASTGVLVRDGSGRIYVHRRAPEKDWEPSSYDAAAGGVLRDGEDPEASARREVAEELGVSGVILRRLLGLLVEVPAVRCFVHVYEAWYDGEVTHADGEVVWGEWVTLEELGRRLRDPAWRFVPDTRRVLRRLYDDGVGDYRALGLEEG